MFKSIDILIGLSVIMLVASMAVTMITQAIIAVPEAGDGICWPGLLV